MPAVADLADLLGYVLSNPYLFISSSTVMTTGLILAAASVGTVALATGRCRGLLHSAAPSLALLLAYFGLGSLLLSIQIFVRFHADIPVPVEIQLKSGLGHFAEALLGIALLSGYLRSRPGRDWVAGNIVALTYWLGHVVVLTPPWFEFQGQRDIILGAAIVILGTGLLVTAVVAARIAPPQAARRGGP